MSEPEVKPKPTYMIYGGRFTGREPYFYDAAEFSWVKALEDNWLVIREEIQSLLERREERLKPYFIKSIVFPPKQWKTMGLYFWKYKLHRNCLDCPQTVRLLESIPHMTGGSLSVLEAGSNINPHQGDTNAIIRVHLGLSVPAPLPVCGFQVGREIRPWEEGKALLFCDAHSHLAWNRSDKRRLILIVDVMRPEFVEQTDAICSHVLATMIVQTIYQASALLNRLPGRFKYGIHFILRNIIRVLLPVQRRAGFLSKLTRS
ncbi:MAG: aspartyl/asparaginyl beta-hydroxylase domain-containing protein [Pyrinomonadaceae bacterium]|nr:aspartyl/asparaginyl beta-hydroxylase domain-containing protein [Pyrinomonadaceae bacterium]